MKTADYPNIGERVLHERLSNGLHVYVVPKAGYFKTRAFFAVNYGGADRKFKIDGDWIQTPAGVAHFLEHKMFDTENGNALNMFFANGASANAFTSSDMTAYYFECTDDFYKNFELLLSFVSTPYFTEESVNKEQGIIGQEIRMTEDNPQTVVYYNLLKLLYKEHPMRESIVGTVEEIAKITPKLLYDCHKTFYNCANMALCVAGDVDPDAVVKAAERLLPRVRGELPQRDYGNDKGEYPNGHKGAAEMDIGIPIFLAGAKVKGGATGKDPLRQELTANLANRLLMGGSSPLYSELYSKGLINQGFTAEYERITGRAMVLFGGESRDPEAVVSAITARAREIAGIENSGLFERQKRSLIGEKLKELNSFYDICYNTAKGCFEGFDPFEAVKILSGITLAEVEAFISDNFSRDKLALSVVSGK